jgi:hypothetical protein
MKVYVTHSVAENVRNAFLSFAEIIICLVATTIAKYQHMSPPMQYEPIIMRPTVDVHSNDQEC